MTGTRTQLQALSLCEILKLRHASAAFGWKTSENAAG
jgi:hypothetical protein